MRPTQFQAKLDRLEGKFRVDLIRGLEAASQDAGSLFFHSETHNPFSEMRGRTDLLTNELLERADEIIRLRTKLKEWPEVSLAARFVNYCQTFFDLDDPHRPGVRKHAQALLDEIKAALSTDAARK